MELVKDPQICVEQGTSKSPYSTVFNNELRNLSNSKAR
jgi:hypothetical protein